MLRKTVRKPDPFAGCIHEKEAQEARDVPCDGCGTETAEGTTVVLTGACYCPECAFATAIQMRVTGALWDSLSRHDQAEVLEVIETGAHIERRQLLRRAA